MFFKCFKYLLFIVAVFWFTGCELEPDHSNPLDPDNPNYEEIGNLRLKVYPLNWNDKPIIGATVLINQIFRFGVTDSSGEVFFDNVPADTLTVIAYRDSDSGITYASDSIDVIIEPSKTKFDSLQLDYEEIGNLRLKVYPLNWNDKPIIGATVLINQIFRFGVTDSSGEVFFDNVPADTLTVIAYRDSDSGITYASDSIEVIIEPGKTTSDSLRLDAVPQIDSSKVNSITLVEDSASIDITRISARLTAWVNDQNGIHDLDRVEYRFADLTGELNYNPDSSYWQVEIPSENFPGSDLRNTLTIPFVLKAFDKEGKSSEATSLLARVISGVPRLSFITGSAEPNLEWNYSLYYQLPNIESFHYLLRIFNADAERDIVYERLVVPDETAYNTHQVEVTLNPGGYFWQVWVIDLFGNMSRSKLEGLEVPLPYPEKTSRE